MGLGLAGMMAGTKMGSSKLAKSLSSKSEKLEKELLGTLWPDWDLCRSMPRTSGSTPANFTKSNFLQKFIQKHRFFKMNEKNKTKIFEKITSFDEFFISKFQISIVIGTLRHCSIQICISSSCPVYFEFYHENWFVCLVKHSQSKKCI